MNKIVGDSIVGEQNCRSVSSSSADAPPKPLPEWLAKIKKRWEKGKIDGHSIEGIIMRPKNVFWASMFSEIASASEKNCTTCCQQMNNEVAGEIVKKNEALEAELARLKKENEVAREDWKTCLKYPPELLKPLLEEIKAEAHTLGFNSAVKEILDREQKMECLKCGKSLVGEIMERKIRIHLCPECRIEEIEKILSQKSEGEKA